MARMAIGMAFCFINTLFAWWLYDLTYDRLKQWGVKTGGAIKRPNFNSWDSYRQWSRPNLVKRYEVTKKVDQHFLIIGMALPLLLLILIFSIWLEFHQENALLVYQFLSNTFSFCSALIQLFMVIPLEIMCVVVLWKKPNGVDDAR